MHMKYAETGKFYCIARNFCRIKFSRKLIRLSFCDFIFADSTANWHYRIAGNFWGVQFSRKGNLQRFCGLIFADGRSRTAPPTIPGWLHLLPHAHAGSNRLIEGKMAHESHVIEAMIRGYHVYKEIWCAAVGEELSCIREENYHDPFTVAVVRSGVIVGCDVTSLQMNLSGVGVLSGSYATFL